MSFFKKALKSAGKVTKLPGKALTAVAKPVNKVGALTKKVPVVGKGLHAVYSVTTATPINITTRLARNPRSIHRVGYDTLKQQVKDVQDLAPYAQAVFSMTPGVGTGISAGIGASLALSKGRGISAALKEGVKGAIPGGPLIQGTYNAVADISSGKPVTKVQFDTLGRAGADDPAAFVADVKGSLNGDVAAMARTNATLNKMKPDAKKAVQVGVAVGNAARLQAAHTKGVIEGKSNIFKTGILKIKANPVLAAGMSIKEFRPGFPYGIGIMAFKLNVIALAKFHDGLKPDEDVGFHAGVACHIGMTSRKPIPGASPMQQLGYYITEGLKGSTDAKAKTAILRVLAENKETKSGANAVIKEIPAEKGWWVQIKEWFDDNF